MSILKVHDTHVLDAYSGPYSYNVVYLESFLGRLQIEECTKCNYLVVTCEHERNSWDEAGKQLTCDLCGIDGT